MSPERLERCKEHHAKSVWLADMTAALVRPCGRGIPGRSAGRTQAFEQLIDVVHLDLHPRALAGHDRSRLDDLDQSTAGFEKRDPVVVRIGAQGSQFDAPEPDQLLPE